MAIRPGAGDARNGMAAASAPGGILCWPEVPTAAQAGLRDFAVTSWQAVMAPAGVAPPLLARVHAAVAEALRHPETVGRLGQIGLTVVADSPESYAAFQRAESERWRGVARAAGIKAE